MKDHQRQALSALVDGELPASQAGGLLDALGRDPDLRAQWERYHLIAGALRGEGASMAWREIAERTRARIAAEPTVLAPAAARPRRPSRLAPFAGVALAASAAFLAVFAVPSLFQSEVHRPAAPVLAQGPVPQLPPQLALQSAPVPASAPAAPQPPADQTLVAANSVPQDAAPRRFEAGRPSQRWHVDQPGVANKLDRLLVNHQEYAPATGINGMMPYATLVSYDTGR
jgi:sigma-E factor negative regulatory protein RseA